jgi:L-phenylalanine/L-methionine N-acetyltransferase
MKIEIRHAEPEDYNALHTIYTGPKVVWGTLQLPFSPAEKQRKRLAEPRDGSYVLVASVEGEVIGHLHLETFPNSPRRKHVGHIGMGVHDVWQGKGIGTALMEAALDFADNWLNLSRLELSVYTDNQPGIHLYQKFGFEIEGQSKQFAFRDGQYIDVYFMGRIKHE